MSAILFKTSLLVICAVLSAGCYTKFDVPEPPNVSEPGLVSCTISQLKGFTSAGYIMEDLVVGGRITSSDSAQNFYKRCYIEDNSGGIQVLIDNYDIYSLYLVGDSVRLNVKGLAVGLRDGVACVGYPTESDYMGPISSTVLLRQIMQTVESERITYPYDVTFDKLLPSDIGRLVEVEVYFPEVYSSTTVVKFVGSRELCDRLGNIAKLQTVAYSSFASSVVPSGWVRLRAIVVGHQPSGAYELKVSSTLDITLL